MKKTNKTDVRAHLIISGIVLGLLCAALGGCGTHVPVPASRWDKDRGVSVYIAPEGGEGGAGGDSLTDSVWSVAREHLSVSTVLGLLK